MPGIFFLTIFFLPSLAFALSENFLPYDVPSWTSLILTVLFLGTLVIGLLARKLWKFKFIIMPIAAIKIVESTYGAFWTFITRDQRTPEEWKKLAENIGEGILKTPLQDNLIAFTFWLLVFMIFYIKIKNPKQIGPTSASNDD